MSNITELKNYIESQFDVISTINSSNASKELKGAVSFVLSEIDAGNLRVAEKIDGQWVVHQWIKKAVLLSFRINDNALSENDTMNYFDKVPLKYADYTAEQFQADGVRAVPGVVVRKGCYIAKNTVLMPSFVNVGAYVDEGTMVDTYVGVGSCAQIGKNVHLSQGSGIGGVLEPLQANPTIIEDNCFIGTGSQVVEGVIVEEGAVIGAGVFLSQSTKIYDRETGEIIYGRVPAGSVVVSGSLPSKDGKCSVAAVIIVKKVDENTRKKVGVNSLLRDE